MTISTGGAGEIWTRFRSGYSAGVLIAFLTLLMASVYFGPTTILPPVMFLGGVFLLGHLDPRPTGAVRKFLPAVVLSAAILVLAFLRSDFVDLILAGKGIGEAYATSTRYFQAPMVMWFTSWAVALAAWNQTEEGSARIIAWLAWLVIAVTVVHFIDVAGNITMRNWMNVHWFKHMRPEMVIVDSSNLNAVLLMLFWPLTLWFVEKGRIWAVGAMAVTIIWGAFVVDTNAHIMVLVAGLLVFLATKYWPPGLSRKGILPERVLAVLATFWVLVFPGVMLVLMRTGQAQSLRDHLPPSWAARIEIWSYAVTEALKKPWMGWGYEAARKFEPYIPNHTHNMSLQAWLELGVPGLLLLAAFWGSIFWFVAPKDANQFERAAADELMELDSGLAQENFTEMSVEQRARPYVLAATAGYFLLNAISYGMWRAWLYCLGALVLAVFILVIKAVRANMKLRTQL